MPTLMNLFQKKKHKEHDLISSMKPQLLWYLIYKETQQKYNTWQISLMNCHAKYQIKFSQTESKNVSGTSFLFSCCFSLQPPIDLGLINHTGYLLSKAHLLWLLCPLSQTMLPWTACYTTQFTILLPPLLWLYQLPQLCRYASLPHTSPLHFDTSGPRKTVLSTL